MLQTNSGPQPAIKQFTTASAGIGLNGKACPCNLNVMQSHIRVPARTTAPAQYPTLIFYFKHIVEAASLAYGSSFPSSFNFQTVNMSSLIRRLQLASNNAAVAAMSPLP
jgi:hypothetical protein